MAPRPAILYEARGKHACRQRVSDMLAETAIGGEDNSNPALRGAIPSLRSGSAAYYHTTLHLRFRFPNGKVPITRSREGWLESGCGSVLPGIVEAVTGMAGHTFGANLECSGWHYASGLNRP